MKDLLFMDAGIFVIAAAIALLKGDFVFLINIVGFAGLIFVVTAGILAGSFVSGDRVRANYDAEYAERKGKNRLPKNLFFVGLFNIVISVLTYEFTLQGIALMH